MKNTKLTTERKQFIIKQAHKCLDVIETNMSIIKASYKKKAA